MKNPSNSKSSFRPKPKDSSAKKSNLNKTIGNIGREEKQHYTPLRNSPERVVKSQAKKKIKTTKKPINNIEPID